jgi:ferritin
MIKKKMEDALNKQINEEAFSSYLYLAMVAYFEEQNLKGFAHWFKTQVQEEAFHMMKLYNHIIERGGSVKLEAIDKPKHGWDSPFQLFEEALNHERHITECINNLMDVAIEEKDHAARNLLNWFVDEQVEEEDQFTEIVEKLKMIGDNKAMLLMLDTEMTQRQPGQNPYFPSPGAGE